MQQSKNTKLLRRGVCMKNECSKDEFYSHQLFRWRMKARIIQWWTWLVNPVMVTVENNAQQSAVVKQQIPTLEFLLTDELRGRWWCFWAQNHKASLNVRGQMLASKCAVFSMTVILIKMANWLQLINRLISTWFPHCFLPLILLLSLYQHVISNNTPL